MENDRLERFFKEFIGRTLVPFIFLGVIPSGVFYGASFERLFWAQVFSGVGLGVSLFLLLFIMHKGEGEVSLYSYSRPRTLYFKIATWSLAGLFLNSLLANFFGFTGFGFLVFSLIILMGFMVSCWFWRT